jgi:hypothetical protein
VDDLQAQQQRPKHGIGWSVQELRCIMHNA